MVHTILYVIRFRAESQRLEAASCRRKLNEEADRSKGNSGNWEKPASRSLQLYCTLALAIIVERRVATAARRNDFWDIYMWKQKKNIYRT